MSERNDRKLELIPVASYNYRHEAEFAAGFLEDAGIPYRLQIEDPTLGLSATNSATLWVTAMDEQRARRVLEEERAVEPVEDDSIEAAGAVGEGAAVDRDRVADRYGVMDRGGVHRKGGEDRSRDPSRPGVMDGEGDRARERAGGAKGALAAHGTAAGQEAGRDQGAAAGRRADRLRGGQRVPHQSAPGVDRHGNVSPDLTLRQRVISMMGSVALSSTLAVEAVREAHEAVPWVVAIVAALLAVAAIFGRAPGPVKGFLSAISGDAP